MHHNNFVQLETFLFIYDAHILRGLLETEDIRVVILDEQFTSLLPIYPSLIGGIRLLVPLRDLDKAKNISIEYFINRDNSKTKCSNCNSLNIKHDYKKQFENFTINSIGAMIGGFPFTSSAYSYKKCQDCGYLW